MWSALKNITNPCKDQEKTEGPIKQKSDTSVIGAIFGFQPLKENEKDDVKTKNNPEEDPKDLLSVSYSEKQVEIIFADVKMEVNFTRLK